MDANRRKSTPMVSISKSDCTFILGDLRGFAVILPRAALHHLYKLRSSDAATWELHAAMVSEGGPPVGAGRADASLM
jgi:hypothetical protein